MSNDQVIGGGTTHIETVPVGETGGIDLYRVDLTGEYGASWADQGLFGIRSDTLDGALQTIVELGTK